MSNNSNQTVVHQGIGFTGLLTIVFIILKLTHYIDWSWWWVLSPLWIELLLAVVGCIGCMIVIPILLYLKKKR